MSRPIRLATAGALSVLALALSPAVALAHGGDDLIDADFTPSLPTDPSINGVQPGGAPWVIDRGEVRVRESGRMDVRIEGLQIPRADGTEDNPVASIVAVLYCGGTMVAQSAPQPLSVPEGDAEFRTSLTVPEHCDMATILISPNGAVGLRFIASAVADDD